MRLEPHSPQTADEQRSYFPDWACRVPEVREELEADHNSYLAGGYAEEFGYWAQHGSSRGVTVLQGELPEECVEWLCQAGGLHPGYPIRPYPSAPEGEPPGNRFTAHQRAQRVVARGERSLDLARDEVKDHGIFIRVTDRPYERERHHFAQRAGAVFTRMLAVLVAIRWKLPRRHRAR